MLIAAVGQYFFGILIFASSMFLIMLVLVQRGRGGGLAGALGGPGGQSAFGTKAGDLFTRITIGVATFWIFLCVVAVLALKEKTLDTGVTRPDSTIQSKGGVSDGDLETPPSDGVPPATTPSTGPATTPMGSQSPIDLNLATPSGLPTNQPPAPATTPGSTIPPPETTLPDSGASGAAEVTELEAGSEETTTASGSEVEPSPAVEEVPDNVLRPNGGEADGGAAEQPTE